MVYNTENSYKIREAMFSKINSINLSDRIFNLLFYDNDLMLVYHINKGTFVINDKRAEKLIITYKINLTEFKKFLSIFKKFKNDFEEMEEEMAECELRVVL